MSRLITLSASLLHWKPHRPLSNGFRRSSSSWPRPSSSSSSSYPWVISLSFTFSAQIFSFHSNLVFYFRNMVFYVTGNLRGTQQHHGWAKMGRCTIAMMVWHHIHMSPFTHLGFLQEGHPHFSPGISMKELSQLVLVALLELGISYFTSIFSFSITIMSINLFISDFLSSCNLFRNVLF